ncbi:MAG: isocitrate lyase/PEP mutase family protein [Alphaproteobacteria bacterium]|nr:isocitrate lyase/PEP mutase family protein [Alphaproteobacteria bacterium]
MGNCQGSFAVTSSAGRLRAVFAEPGIRVTACCFDALSARLIERAGFPLSFMSGFAVSAVRLGLPDTGLISFAEMADQGRNICAAVDIPVIGDGDTGYGNAINVKRTVDGYRRAGFAGVMLEDQVSPKRCGHTRGKQVVDRGEALARVRAAVDARDEGDDILIVARTDARGTDGIDEAIWRAQAFADFGADITFVEAPSDEMELARICKEIPTPQMANMVHQGLTPVLSPQRLEELGFKLAIYPFTPLAAAIKAMSEALAALAEGRQPVEMMTDFGELCEIVGFDDYYAAEDRYLGG